MHTDAINRVKERLASAHAIAVLTGAGISADSGIPTFRGSGQATGSASDWPGPGGIGGSASGGPHGPPHLEAGLWRNFRAEELATPEAFARNPQLVWEWYDWRRGLIASKAPNAGHYTLAEIEKRSPRFTLITQNVDGFHALAGSRNLIELHGNIWKVRCTRCGQVSVNRDVPIEILPYCQALNQGAAAADKEKGPHMPPEPPRSRGQSPTLATFRRCEGLLRPYIVWFGETLDAMDIEKCVAALQSCDLLLVIGTSGVVWPAASFAEIAKSSGAFVVEVNLKPSAQSEVVDETLQGRASEILPQFLP